MNSSTVLIVGAGPTGMTAAIELKRAGLNVRIIDKCDHLALHSQALVVQARTLEQLQRYGLAAEAVAQGRKLGGVKFFSEGKQLVAFKADGIPSRYPYVLFLPQSKTEAILNQHMESLGVKTERQVELIALTQQDDVVHATLRHGDGRTEDIAPRWVIGCDGGHSAVRKMMKTPFEGGGIGLFFFLGDLEIDGPDAPTDELAIHLHRGDVVFMGRLTDQWVRLIVALHEQQDEDERRELTTDDFQRAVDQVGVRVKIRSADWMTPFRVNDRQAESYRIGNVFLAGDAAHIHSPVGGQGMNTGIQDAANLAWKLAAVARGGDEKLLDSYDEERGAVGKALLRMTERGLKMATSANRLVEGARDALMPLIASLHSVQKSAMGFISETAIEYRSSSVVKDDGGDGDLRAGDRLPDFAVKRDGKDKTLLQNWTSGRHLAVVMNGSADEVAEVAMSLWETDAVILGLAELDEEGRRFLGAEKKLIAIRPDGYVGYRGPLDRKSDWKKYARQDGLIPG